LVCYGIASTAYRILISIQILLFLSNRLPEPLFIVVPFLAISAVIMWVLVPLGRFVHYLLTHGELTRTRLRAEGSTAGFCIGVTLLVGLVPFHDYFRIEGVVEPVKLAIVHTRKKDSSRPYYHLPVRYNRAGQALIQMINPRLVSERSQLAAQKEDWKRNDDSLRPKNRPLLRSWMTRSRR